MPLLGPPNLYQEPSQRPALQSSRINDDWSFLGHSKKTEKWDGLKYIQVGRERGTYLTLGGEARETYEFFRNAGFGEGLQNDNGYLLERYRLSFDLHLRDSRAFIELNRSSVEGRRGGSRPSDENRTDFYQAFAELTPKIRLGRQEISFGSGRMFALKEGSNVPLSFDGVRLSTNINKWHLDLIGLRPVTSSFGAFDDRTSNSQQLWGAYATAGGSQTIDLYYVARDRDSAKFAQGLEHEIRHTFGVRSFGRSKLFTRDYEAIYQVGSFGGAPISAYRVALDTFYDIPSRLKWKIGLRLDKGSGDGNSADHELHTYDGLFQSGSYSGKPGLLGPANEMDLEPSISCIPWRGVSASAAIGFLWRSSDSDATYLINGTPDRYDANNRAQYVGSRTTVNLNWQANPHLSYSLNYIYVVPGRYYSQTGASGNESYLAVWTTYRF